MYKKIVEGKKAIFFDLDGTVVKSTTDYMTDAVQKVLDDTLQAAYINAKGYVYPGLPVSKRWESILKINTFETPRTVDELTELTHKAFIEIINNTELSLTEGFWEFMYEIKEEKKLKTALTTNTPRAVASVVLDKLEITKAFDFIICGDEVKRTKPNPEMYKKAAKALKVRPKRVTVFEDSLAGVSAAAAANMDIVVMYDHKTPKFEFPGKILLFVDDFSDLPGKLDDDWVHYMAKRAKETAKLMEEENP